MSPAASEPVKRPAAARQEDRPKRGLDTVVKMGLGVFIGSFMLIWGGMFLTRPDRTIPPFSVGSQEGPFVAVHVPPSTSDAAVETLIQRFRRVGRETRNFGTMKIQPTTPDDPKGRYRHIVIYVFAHDAWAEPELLHRYVHALEAGPAATADDRSLREGFEKALRGFYRLNGSDEEGRLGPVPRNGDTPATAAYSRLLFRERLPESIPKEGASSRSTVQRR
jgi:hypothetical protein